MHIQAMPPRFQRSFSTVTESDGNPNFRSHPGPSSNARGVQWAEFRKHRPR